MTALHAARIFLIVTLLRTNFVNSFAFGRYNLLSTCPILSGSVAMSSFFEGDSSTGIAGYEKCLIGRRHSVTGPA